MTDLLTRLTAALADRYAIERELGAGGMATVYLARDLKHDREVAVKVLRPELAAAMGADRFLREIQIAAKLTHPHILPLYDSGEADGQLFYVMPYIEGESLRDRIDREGQLGVEEALQIVREVGSALSHAHAMGLVHRDIKPDNILLSGGHAVVADFGIARAVSAAGGEQLTETGLSVGTPHYMSPEQASGEKTVDGRSDEYALACVLYELLVGQPPFTGPTAMAVIARHTLDPVPSVRTVRNTIPVELEGALMKGLAKVPADRFATVQQFVEAVTGQGYTGTLPTPPGAGTARRAWARPVGIGVAAVAGLIAAVLVGRQLDLGALFAPAVEERVAVLDFEGFGLDSLAYLTEAIPEFLSLALTGETGGPRALDRRVVTKAWRAVEGTTSDPTQRYQRVAERVGATHVVSGQVIQQRRDSVVVTASLYAGREVVAQARAAIAVGGQPTALAEQVGVQLLAAAAGQFERLPGLMSSSTEAVQLWIEGQRAYRDGRFRRAVELQWDALDLDSTFALAAWGMMKSAQWLAQPGPWSGRGARLAWEHRDRLPRADSLIFNAEWHRNHISDEWIGERGSFALYRAAVLEYPERWDAWLLYADYLWHEGGFFVDDGRPMAIEGFDRALSLDSLGHDEPWQHVAERYVLNRDAEGYARMPEQHQTVQGDNVMAMLADTALDATFWQFYEGDGLEDILGRWRQAHDAGHQEEASRYWQQVMAQAQAYFWAVNGLMALQASGGGMRAAEHLAEILERRAAVGDPNSANVAGVYWLNRGSPNRATPLLEIASTGPPCGDGACQTPYLWLQQGAFAGADPRVVARIRDSLGLAHAEMRADAHATPGSSEYSEFRRQLHERFWAVILDLAQGRTDDFETTRRLAREAESKVDTPRRQHLPKLMGAFLDAIRLTNDGRSEAREAVLLADSALSMAMTPRSQMAWLLVLARLYQQVGMPEDALDVIRRQGMIFGEEYVHLLPARLLLRARLAKQLGLTDEAIQAYDHYLNLRSDPEQALAGEAAEARAELAELVGDRRSGE